MIACRVRQKKFSLARLAALVQHSHIISLLLVDCTSSEDIAAQYADFLAAGFRSNTKPRKQIQLSMAYYHQLREVARNSRRKLMYETTVGAGLPVIENLQNLISGDELEKSTAFCLVLFLTSSVSLMKVTLSQAITCEKAAATKNLTHVMIYLVWMWRVSYLFLLVKQAWRLSLKTLKLTKLYRRFDDSGTVEEFVNRLPGRTLTSKAIGYRTCWRRPKYFVMLVRSPMANVRFVSQLLMATTNV